MDTTVTFGLELSLDPWVLSSGSDISDRGGHPPVDQHVYDLMAVINHSGTVGGGHYTAHARHPVSGRWYAYNDAWVSRTISSYDTDDEDGDSEGGIQASTLERVLVTPAAYVLLYRKRHGGDAAVMRHAEASSLSALLAAAAKLGSPSS